MPFRLESTMDHLWRFSYADELWRTDIVTELMPQLDNQQTVFVTPDWLFVSGVYRHDGDTVYYVYEQVASDQWQYRYYGVESVR